MPSGICDWIRAIMVFLCVKAWTPHYQGAVLLTKWIFVYIFLSANNQHQMVICSRPTNIYTLVPVTRANLVLQGDPGHFIGFKKSTDQSNCSICNTHVMVSPHITNDVDILFKNGCLCGPNAVRVNGLICLILNRFWRSNSQIDHFFRGI